MGTDGRSPARARFDMMSTQSDALLTPAQAAKYLGLTTRFLEARRYRGGGPPYIAIGSRVVRYQKAALDEWLSERVRTSTSDPGPGDASGRA